MQHRIVKSTLTGKFKIQERCIFWPFWIEVKFFGPPRFRRFDTKEAAQETIDECALKDSEKWRHV